MIAEPTRTAWDLKWTMFRIPCRVSPWFWLVSFLFCYDFGQPPPMPFVCIGIGCMFLSILVHEYGHAFAGRYYGDDENYTILYWLGGLCVPGKGVPPRMPRIVVLLWGPGAEFILGAIAGAVILAARRDLIHIHNDYLWAALINLMYISFIWAGMNLVPVYPLDGGQILLEIVRWKAPQRGELFGFTVSMVAAIIITVGAIGFAGYRAARGQQDPRDLFPAFLFGQLAFKSYQYRKHIEMYGQIEGITPERREAWEQDPDWWKRGGR
jgi:stage IV sporulation protein FB